ncbi:putative ABC transport system permease protein [Thermocatellispora tengchongensis]|uniref:Putative ABC transport system permease protein n=1 Tax=Thermocatellispora tengchongensis TaxID=1073253 RepID=A0A840PAF7_9ACTN|nr:ABC transporter permease [Thermocatellispora tengchongensis]MBB5136628.1 putative ABC transport system permease protein [Thermocatellispora tengchongensis]
MTGAPRERTAAGRRARLSPADLLRVGASGLRARPARVFLSALGIAIGIAAMVSVVGISASSRADLDAQIGRLGTNLLTVGPGDTFLGGRAELPPEATAMIRRVDGVLAATSTARIEHLRAYRNDRIPKGESGGISVHAADLELPAVLRARMAVGTWLNAATARYPVVVLGHTAAARLGVTRAGPGVQVLVGEVYHTVAGILAPVELAPEIDTAALVGGPSARRLWDHPGHPTRVYVRADEERIEKVRDLLAPTAYPQSPADVEVSRPSDALAAKRLAEQAFTGLLLGLGAVALLVGGVGVANTMVISVLERRGEIGLRRALGASRGQILAQFLVEAVVLSALGGLAGAVLGTLLTAAYAVVQGWAIVVPAAALGGGVAATAAIGAAAGLWPAVRAARLSPTEALATP